MFPEIRRLLKRFTPDSGELVSLGLKSDYATFGTTDINQIAKWPRLYAALGGMPSWSGEIVTRETALSHSAMWAAYCLICEQVAALPADVKQLRDGSRRDATDHPMFSAMRDSVDGEVTAQVFREMETGHCLLEGDGFAKIIRRSGTGTAIYMEPLLPGQVRTDRENQGQKRKVYIVLNESGAADKTYTVERGKPKDIFHLQNIGYDGIRGYSLLAIGRQVIGTALAAERNVSSFWANGGRKPYWLERMVKFGNDEDFKKWRSEFKDVYRDPSNAIVFQDGTKLHEIGTSLKESQALESRQHAVTEFCRLTGATPHLVAHLVDSNYSITEQLFLEFKTITLRKWTKRWEQAFNFYVLTPEERAKGYYLKINLNAFLQADFKTRMEGYATGLQNGFLNIDGVLALEDDNPLPNGAGQTHRVQLNMGTVPGTGTPSITEQALLARIEKEKQLQKQPNA